MIALYIIGGLVLLVVLAGRIPLRVTGEYSGEGTRVTVFAGPLRLWQYPSRKKTKERQAPAEAAPAQRGGEKSGGRLQLFREMLGLVMEFQRALRNRLVIQELTLHLTVGGKGDDPATAAVLYGSAWAAIGELMPVLERSFRIKSRDVQAQVDFLQESTTVYARATAGMSLGAMVRMALYYGLRGIKQYRTVQKKGGTKDGTSDQ